MADDLRARVLAAASGVRLRFGPNALDLASRGEPLRLSGGEAEALTDAVMAVLGGVFRPAPPVDALAPLTDEEIGRLKAAFDDAQKSWDGTYRVLRPNAVMIYSRTPGQRREYLVEHRDEALAAGLPGDLIDLLIAEAGAGVTDA
jgi:hypothetical protein